VRISYIVCLLLIIFVSAGNQYTSTKDLRTWGQAIWTNKLLDPVTTRRWLKPGTFTSRWTSAVGVGCSSLVCDAY